MGSSFTSGLPAPTTASLARMIDLGLLSEDNIIDEPNHPIAAEIQQFIREYTTYTNKSK